MKRCLILSQGPPPTPEHPVVEGGGLRCWGLATGIKANAPALEVVLAYHDAHRIEGNFTADWEGVHVRTWRHETVKELMAGFDSIVVSYCMGDLSTLVARMLSETQQLVLDCYVP